MQRIKRYYLKNIIGADDISVRTREGIGVSFSALFDIDSPTYTLHFLVVAVF